VRGFRPFVVDGRDAVVGLLDVLFQGVERGHFEGRLGGIGSLGCLFIYLEIWNGLLARGRRCG
jgi:hypothetical protein